MSYSRDQDSDEGRLPDGMERVGYDADTQSYTYRARDGSHWEGAPGNRYGVLRPSGTGYQPMTTEDEQAMRRNDKEAWRYLLPFFLMIAVFLLVLYRFLGSSTAQLECPENSVRYEVQPDDSCWAIADARGKSVEDLVRLNAGLNCDLLQAGKEICVPAN